MKNIIKYSQDHRWFMTEQNESYYFFNADGEKAEPVKTPNGELLETSYLVLAERILSDLEIFGDRSMIAQSIMPWHFTMIDNFVKMKHKQVERMLDECFMQKYDWTYDISDPGSANIFGKPKERTAKIRAWLAKCTHMQMTAACCIGNAYYSINLAYVLAVLVEAYEGEELNKQLKALAAIVEEYSVYGDDFENILIAFETFVLYYGIHLAENGYIIVGEKISLLKKRVKPEELSLTEDILIGRNFYHYTYGKCSEHQPFTLSTDLSDIEEVPDEEDDGAESNEDINKELNKYLPSDCWLKKISAYDEDDEEIYYIIAIAVEGGRATNIVVVRDKVSRAGCGMLCIPNTAIPSSHYYDEIDFDDYPEIVCCEFDALRVGKYLPNNFTFIGKKLPQAILDMGGNGGDMTEHTYAIPSAYRLAYMHMSVLTTEEGVIEDFDYSTYQSSGSAYSDMFSHPQMLDDRHEEIVDMLLYIVDLYTDEEYKQLFQ